MRYTLIKHILFTLYCWVFVLLDFFIPKSKEVRLFASQSGLTGNLRFFADYILSNTNTKLHFISCGKSKETEDYFITTYGNRVTICRSKSVKSCWVALRAKQVFITHDLYRDIGFPLRKFGRRRLIINLWHGIAMKKHWLLTREKAIYPYKSRARQFSAIVASSAADAIAKAAVFQKPLSDIWITGNPRNDFLAGRQKPMAQDLAEQQLLLHDKMAGKALILYAPTWRKFQQGFSPFPSNEVQLFSDILQQHNAVLGIRLHEKDEQQFAELYNSPAVLNLGAKIFPEAQVILKSCNLLITDYSSIWLDFILTDRPVIGYWFDWHVYQQRMGTIWNVPQLFPGQIIYSFTDLLKAVKANAENQFNIPAAYRDKYQYTKALFHQNYDGNNSRRLMQKLEGTVDV